MILIVKLDLSTMCEIAADYYKELLKKPKNIYRLHLYTDASEVEWENYEEEILPRSIDEV